MNFSSDLVIFNRKAAQKVKASDGRGITRWVYAFGAEKMSTVSSWKVDKGGGEVLSFAPAVQYAVYQVLAYNAQMFFGKKPDAEFIGQLTTLIISKKGDMSLYGFIDAVESLMSREAPCDIEQYGFDAKAILRACDLYWAKARDEYYNFNRSVEAAQFRDIKPGDPVPASITELRKKLEEKHGVIYDEASNRDVMRAAAEKYKAEQGALKFD